MTTKPLDDVGVDFVNTVLGVGVLNGVVNIQFGVYLFSPNDAERKIEFDPAIGARLRMDIPCAEMLRDMLVSQLGAPRPYPPKPEVPSEERDEKDMGGGVAGDARLN